MYQIHKDRTVTHSYVNEVCKQVLRSEVYHCEDPNSIFHIFSFLAQRQIGYQLNYHNGNQIHVFQIRFYINGNGKPKTFVGRAEKPSVAAALALMQAVEDE